MISFLTTAAAVLVAQAISCGTYGATPSSPGGCTVNGVYLQEVNGVLIRQDPPLPRHSSQYGWQEMPSTSPEQTSPVP